MRFARIINGIVVNTEEVSSEWYLENSAQGVLSDVAGYGDVYDGISFTSPPVPAAERKAAIQSQIDAAERAQMMPRITREALLAIAVSQAPALGLTESQLYAANIGYRKLKDFEASIVALRDQMRAIV